MVVEMWDALPDAPQIAKPLEVVAPPPPPKAIEPEPVLPSRAEIELEKRKISSEQNKKKSSTRQTK